jgi:hypothetical protein
MTDEALASLLTQSMKPYVLAFLKKPDRATWVVTVDGTSVDGLLALAATDHTRVRGDAVLRSHFSRMFNKLCAHLDSRKLPTISYESVGR